MIIQTDLFGEPPTPQTKTKAGGKAHKNRVMMYNSMRSSSSQNAYSNESFGKRRNVKQPRQNPRYINRLYRAD